MRRGWLVRRMLLAADLLALATAFAVVEVFFRKSHLVGDVGVGVETLIFLGLLPIWVLAAKLYGALRPRRGQRHALDGGRGRQRLSSRHSRRLGFLRNLMARRPLEP